MERRNTSYGGDDYEGILLRSYGKTKVTWAAMMLISQLYILLQHSRSTRFLIDEKSYYFGAMLGKDSCGVAWCLQLQSRIHDKCIACALASKKLLKNRLQCWQAETCMVFWHIIVLDILGTSFPLSSHADPSANDYHLPTYIYAGIVFLRQAQANSKVGPQISFPRYMEQNIIQDQS